MTVIDAPVATDAMPVAAFIGSPGEKKGRPLNWEQPANPTDFTLRQSDIFQPNRLQLQKMRRDIQTIVSTLIAPNDFASWPLYMVWLSELQTGFDGVTMCGFTIHSLDLIARPYIRNWQGRGPAFAVNDIALTVDANSFLGYRASRPDEARRWFDAAAREIALHEVAHILDRGVERGEPPAPELMEAVRQAINGDVKATVSHEPPVHADPFHGPRWMRAALHVTWRHNQRTGRVVSYESVLTPWNSGLSPAWDYYAALGNEPERMADQTFGEILSSPLPAAFAELWESDIKKLQRAAA